MKILSRLLHWEEFCTNLKGLILGSRGPSLTHLLFADDLILFGLASAREARVFSRCLSKFQSWSGQTIYPFKFCLLLISNTSPETAQTIKDILGVRTTSFNSKHLGLPLSLAGKLSSFLKQPDPNLSNMWLLLFQPTPWACSLFLNLFVKVLTRNLKTSGGVFLVAKCIISL